MMTLLITTVVGLAALAVLFVPRSVHAHCDTMDGPTAKDGKKSLETKNLNYAKKWIPEEGEAELEEIFALAVKVRALGEDARKVADRYFLENLVRLHRAGEGEPFTGLKPEGVPIEAKVAAADKSIEIGNLSPLEGMVTPEERVELGELLATALDLKDFDVEDVEAGRAYIAAYVDFFKFAEGEAHHHEAGQAHGAEHVHAGQHHAQGH